MNQAPRIKGWYFVVLFGAAYIASFGFLYRMIGDGALTFSLIPIVVSAWLYGRRGGVFGSIAFVTLPVVLIQIQESGNIFQPVQFIRAVLATTLGIAVGWARDSERRLRHLFEAAPDGLLVANRAGKIVMVNRQVERLFGYQRTELKGQPIEVLVPDRLKRAHVGDRDRYFSTPRDRLMGASAPALTGRRKDGSELPVDISLAPHQGLDGLLVIAAIRDVSERRALEDTQRTLEQERSRRAASDETSRMKSSFIGLISHEIKTPLASLNVHLRVLLKAFKPSLNENQKETLAAIERSTKRLTSLVDSILEYSRLEATTLSLRNEVLNPMALIDDAINEVHSLAAGKQLRVTSHVDGVISPLRGDPTFLRIIIKNLIENAIKFTDRGFVEVTASMSENVHVFAVRDSGPGIPPEDQSRVFEPFTQLVSAEHKHAPGVGLGLALVKSLAQAMGGQVELESQTGQGSIFRLRLPSAPNPENLALSRGAPIDPTAVPSRPQQNGRSSPV